ncbi:unnamed protein product [Calypogeia fissa]
MDSQLSKLSILVAQLESILAASSHQNLEPLFCFDLLVDLLATISQEPRWSLVRCQKKCEDALQALLVLGVAPPVRRLAATATVHLIEKGDHISIYTRTSLLQMWLSDQMDRRSAPSACIGMAQCLGALLQAFGNKLTSGLIETSSIVAKLMRYSEVSVRQAALALLQDALEGSGGGGAGAAYSEALRIITRIGVHDRSALVRTAAAGCLRVFAVVGGPGVGNSGLESCCVLCLKALEDSTQTVRDAFAAALGALLALGYNPEAQLPQQGTGKGPPPAPPKPLEGGLQKHLINPFVKANGPNYKEIRVSLTMALVAFLQGMRLNYLRSDSELIEFAMQAIGMLAFSPDTHAQACILFCLRVGIIEQMGESTQKQFTDHLIQQVSAPDINPAMLVVILRTLSHLLATLGEISETGHDALDNSLVTMLSNPSRVVRVEAALVLRTLAEVDATSANNILSCGVTTLRALRETVAVEKGERLRQELDSLHGQAAMLSAILTACPRLVLGVPSRLPAAVWDLAKAMVLQKKGNPMSVGAENEAGWMLIASIVSSMPKEEIEEQKIDLLLLWTKELGEKIEERLKGSQSMLQVQLNVWSAALEALHSFVTNFVVPSMAATINEGILLQPLISYLSKALSYLSSNVLQQATSGLKPAIDLFTIRMLRAFQAIPDPVTYQQDHSRLLSLCTAPFRESPSFGASSCLRQLLDSRDASLGPWIPGRDSFEDELRAFEGGADDLSPCVWDYELSAFPQPLPLTTMLLDEMLLCFGTVFAAQKETKKLQYIQIVVDAARAGKRQAWHSANMTNTCVALLQALKASIGLRPPGSDMDAMKQLQAILQGILGDDEASPAQRRAAAEGLGILARLGSDAFAVSLTRTLLTEARAPANYLPLKGSIALALGCVHQSVGAMALSALVPATVRTLCALAKDPSDGFPVWSLHGLWLTADAAGLAYVPQVQATLSLVMDLLLSEKHVAAALGQSIGRLINAIVAVLGPELSPGSSLFTRCNAVVAEVGTSGEPAALLECVLFTQQLVLFAPLAVPVHAHVNSLRPTLTSRQPSLRQAAVSTLHHLSEKDAVAMCEERIEQDLFAMLDKETDENIIHVVRLTLQRLFEESCPSFPSRWLHLCRNVVLSASTTKAAAAAAFEGGPDYDSHLETEGEMLGDDDQGMMMESSPTGLYGRHDDDAKIKGMDQLPRFKTRVFAAECLRRLPAVVGVDPTHFDLGRAKSLESFGDWLVLHLGELVAVAYQIATGPMEIIRPMGIELLDVILEKFGETRDEMYEGHLLLEQYQAQLVSAARTALDHPSASPLLVASGSKLAARIITSGNADGDIPLLQRLVNLLTKQLLRWDDIVNPNFAEWVGCKVQVSLLGALACLKTHARNSPDGKMINSLLAKQATTLGPYWVGLLRDFTALTLHRKTKLPIEYHPFLEGIHIVTIAREVEQYLSEVWLFVLEAVTLDALPNTSAKLSDKEDDDESDSTQQGIVLRADDFRQVWALCMLIITNAGKKSIERRPSVRGIPSHQSPKLVRTATPELIALNSLRCLCSKGFYTPDTISVMLCTELMQFISPPSLSEVSASAVLSLVDQVVKSCPPSYLESHDISLRVVELCLYHIFQSLNGKVVSPSEVVDKSQVVMSSALGSLGNLVGHLSAEVGDLLLPQLLSAGIKLLNLVSVDGTSVTSSTLDFMSSLIAAIATPPMDCSTDEGDTFDKIMRASLLAAGVESLAQLCIRYAAGHAEKDQDEEDGASSVSSRIKIFLKVILDMVAAVPDINMAEGRNFRKGAQACCIDCLHYLLSSGRDVLIQLAGLESMESVVSRGGATKQPSGGEETPRAWAILLLREVGADVVQTVYSSIQKPLTTASAAAVAESLKLLILWHSLVEGDKAQQNVLHLLLPAMIGAATAETEAKSLESGNAPLRTSAVKLVTRLASVPSTAAQLKAVMLELRPESRQQLQTIIKASIQQQQQQPTGKPGLPTPLPPLELPKPSAASTASTSNGPRPLFPPPSSSPLPPPPAEIKSVPEDGTEEEDDDDWDDFQGTADDTSESAPAPHLPEVDKEMTSEAKDVDEHITSEGNSSQSQALPTEYDEPGEWSTFDSGGPGTTPRHGEREWKDVAEDGEATAEVPATYQTSHDIDQDMDYAAAENPLEWNEAVDDHNPERTLEGTFHQVPENGDQDIPDLNERSQEMEVERAEATSPSSITVPSVGEEDEAKKTGLGAVNVAHLEGLQNVESSVEKNVSLEDKLVVESKEGAPATELVDEDVESEYTATPGELTDEEVDSENRATAAELRDQDVEIESRVISTEHVEIEDLATKAKLSDQEEESVYSDTATEFSNQLQLSAQRS